MPSEIKSYRDLIVWQKSMDLVVASYEVAKKIPHQEIYGLIAQIQSAAVSIPATSPRGMAESIREIISITSRWLAARSSNSKLTS